MSAPREAQAEPHLPGATVLMRRQGAEVLCAILECQPHNTEIYVYKIGIPRSAPDPFQETEGFDIQHDVSHRCLKRTSRPRFDPGKYRKNGKGDFLPSVRLRTVSENSTVVPGGKQGSAHWIAYREPGLEWKVERLGDHEFYDWEFTRGPWWLVIGEGNE